MNCIRQPRCLKLPSYRTGISYTCTVLLKLSDRISICVCELSSSRVGVVPPGGDCVSALERDAVVVSFMVSALFHCTY